MIREMMVVSDFKFFMSILENVIPAKAGIQRRWELLLGLGFPLSRKSQIKLIPK
jgi:hypothetical protein